jgi:two-component system, cell cycle sensor histidine kinase and response regulator CckA
MLCMQRDGEESNAHARGGPAQAAVPSELGHAFSDRLVVEHLPDAVTVHDRHQTIVYYSGRETGYYGKRGGSFVAPEYRDHFDEVFERAWSRCEPQDVEYATLPGRFWLTRLVPIQRDGVVEYMLATTHEITARVRERRALHELATHLQHASDVAGMGTWTSNSQTGAVVWDDALRAILGLGADVPASFEHFMDRVHPDDRERVLATINYTRHTQGASELEFRIVRPSGEQRFVLSRTRTQRDAHGTAIGMLGATFDLTDRKRLEEQLYQRQKMESIGELTAGIAHNFNNLLSVILPSVELCLEDAPAKLVAPLTDIEHATKRAAELIRQLMLFARNDTAAAKSPVDPVGMLQRVVTICQSTFGRSIHVQLRAGSNPPRVLANSAMLEQVFLNMCINARDAFSSAHTSNPRILLRVERAPAGGVHFSVSDNGPGMDEPTRARVFEPFFTTKGAGRGTGLGLATAYAIVRDHGGNLRCESEPGRGATFEFELPELPRESTAPQASGSAREQSHPGRETILLVDDDDLVRRATRAMLVHHGYNVLESRTGTDALAMCAGAGAHIDLVVLDRSLPDLSGERVLDMLRERVPALPVVLLSGHTIQQRNALQADAALNKPVDIDTLLRTLRSVLDARRAR